MADIYYQGFCRPPKWDVAEGARMYAGGVRVCDIARKLGASYTSVYFRARRYWSRETAERYEREVSTWAD